MTRTGGSGKTPRTVLVLGAAGMLGHVLFSRLSAREGLEVRATARTAEGLDRWFPPDLQERIRSGVDAGRFETVRAVLDAVRPGVVINCIGVVKQLPAASDPVVSITVNSLFPHRLARACAEIGARMIHVSTDCVFSGDAGNYREIDRPDASDLYGRTKLLGEVDAAGCVTLRTSLIGHELAGRHGLVEWFLAQNGPVKGYARTIFSGVPTVEMARIVAERILPDTRLQGLYHVSAEPVSKYDLLRMVANAYGKRIGIERDETTVCDRSLDSSRFREATGYRAPPWPEMVDRMRDHYRDSPLYGSRARME